MTRGHQLAPVVVGRLAQLVLLAVHATALARSTPDSQMPAPRLLRRLYAEGRAAGGLPAFAAGTLRCYSGDETPMTDRQVTQLHEIETDVRLIGLVARVTRVAGKPNGRLAIELAHQLAEDAKLTEGANDVHTDSRPTNKSNDCDSTAMWLIAQIFDEHVVNGRTSFVEVRDRGVDGVPARHNRCLSAEGVEIVAALRHDASDGAPGLPSVVAQLASLGVKPSHGSLIAARIAPQIAPVMAHLGKSRIPPASMRPPDHDIPAAAPLLSAVYLFCELVTVSRLLTEGSKRPYRR